MGVGFTDLDLGTSKPTPVPTDIIEVEVDTSVMLGGYAKAFIKEANRVHSSLLEREKLTEEEVLEYCDYLLDQRVKYVNDECNNWRMLKNMYIPSFIQYALTMVGNVLLRDRGIKIVPIKSEHSKLSDEEAKEISDKIGAFIDDLQIVQDAMPRETNGDADVMTSALIAGYVTSMKPVGHVISTYITAFLGLKLKEELTFKVLYRVQYDDLNFIAQTLCSERRIM